MVDGNPHESGSGNNTSTMLANVNHNNGININNNMLGSNDPVPSVPPYNNSNISNNSNNFRTPPPNNVNSNNMNGNIMNGPTNMMNGGSNANVNPQNNHIHNSSSFSGWGGSSGPNAPGPAAPNPTGITATGIVTHGGLPNLHANNVPPPSGFDTGNVPQPYDYNRMMQMQEQSMEDPDLN